MNILVWIIFGAIAGWLASKIMGTDDQQGAIANVVVGVLGAVIGGFIMQELGGSGITGFNLISFLVAIFGAVLLLGIYKMVRGRA